MQSQSKWWFVNRLGNLAEWSVPPLLALSAVISYAHESYAAAVVSAACAGFCFGLKLAVSFLFKQRLERAVQHELDELFKVYR